MVFATKDVVLDYVMGLLILIEGHFFKGDYVVVPGHTGVEGVVEEIGLRRTVLRDGFGAAHAVSNGFIRLSSNRARLFSAAVADVFVLHAADLDRAISVAHDVADALAGDQAWAARLDASVPVGDVSVVAIGMDGALVRITQVVQTGLQGIVASASSAGGSRRRSWRPGSPRAASTRRCISPPSRVPAPAPVRTA